MQFLDRFEGRGHSHPHRDLSRVIVRSPVNFFRENGEKRKWSNNSNRSITDSLLCPPFIIMLLLSSWCCGIYLYTVLYFFLSPPIRVLLFTTNNKCNRFVVGGGLNWRATPCWFEVPSQARFNEIMYDYYDHPIIYYYFFQRLLSKLMMIQAIHCQARGGGRYVDPELLILIVINSSWWCIMLEASNRFCCSTMHSTWLL